MTSTVMRVISLGWGVQSFTLAAMSALGDLEPVDVAIHADTLHESKLTYEFTARWTPWLEERGVKVVTVKNPTGGVWEILKNPGQIHLPAYTLAKDNTTRIVPETDYVWSEDGEEVIEIETGRMIEIKPSSEGKLNRSCTHRWKIVPMRRWIQENRGIGDFESAYEDDNIKVSKRPARNVEQWLGISLDEFQRMKDSDVKYITHRWPLIEKRMTRQDCIEWLDKHGIEVPTKSACTFCPFHNTTEWRRMKGIPEDWSEAVAVDNAIRNVRPPYDLYVHRSLVPLTDVDLRSETDRGQLSLWDAECSGVCGV